MMQAYSLADWESYFETNHVSKKSATDYMLYLRRMYQSGYPPIFEFRHLAKLLGRTPKYLASAVNCPQKHYRTFEILKRSGGSRTIWSPYPALLECQRWINRNILSQIPIHSASHGFTHERSILSNAKHHLDSDELIKMDLKDFFTSISLRRIISVFMRIGYPHNVSFYLAQLCCCNEVLPQGAATSPSLSNIVSKRMDSRLFVFCTKLGLKYSRYADDIAISGPKISLSILKFAEKVITEEGFRVNTEKTCLYRLAGKRILTGISVSGEEPKIPKDTKRRLRQEAYYVIKYGVGSHTQHNEINDPSYLNRLYGKLMFWKFVEPQNSYLLKALPEIYKMITCK